MTKDLMVSLEKTLRTATLMGIIKVNEMVSLMAGFAALREELAHAHGYLSRLFKHMAPQCEPLETLLGVCTQIDNALTMPRYSTEAVDALLALLKDHSSQEMYGEMLREGMGEDWDELDCAMEAVLASREPPLKASSGTSSGTPDE